MLLAPSSTNQLPARGLRRKQLIIDGATLDHTSATPVRIIKEAGSEGQDEHLHWLDYGKCPEVGAYREQDAGTHRYTFPGSGAFGVGAGALKPPASSGAPSIVSDPVPRSGAIARKGDARTHQPYAMAHVMSAVLIVISPNLMA